MMLFAVVWFSAVCSAFACDACGCGVGSGGPGILTAYRQNFVGLAYYQAAFRSDPDHGNSKDIFRIFEVSGRYYLSDRIKLLAQMSYRANERTVLERHQSVEGFGDLTFSGSYTLFNDLKVGQTSFLFAEAGLGVKLPTGSYDPDIHQSDLPENFNPGQGNVGLVFQPAVVLRAPQGGLALDGRLQYQFKSRGGYRYGHQSQIQLIVFREWSVGENVHIIPLGGMQLEYNTRDHYATDVRVPGTGGTSAFGMLGLNVKGSSWLAGCTYRHPLVQNLSEGEVHANGRWSVQCAYLFSSSN